MCDKHSSVRRTIREKEVRLDSCIADEVTELNRRGVLTVGSCCGHHIYQKSILKRKRGVVGDIISGIKIPRTRNFYRMDSRGFYYIPEAIHIPSAESSETTS